MTQVAQIFEAEKQAALTPVVQIFEEEKKQALKEKEEQVTQATSRQIVIRMIKKDYTSEEIASVVSSFSQDDVDALRKEIREKEN